MNAWFQAEWVAQGAKLLFECSSCAVLISNTYLLSRFEPVSGHEILLNWLYFKYYT